MAAALVALAAAALGIAFVVGDHHVARAVLRRAEEPESGAATVRMLGLVLFVAGAVGFLAWTP